MKRIFRSLAAFTLAAGLFCNGLIPIRQEEANAAGTKRDYVIVALGDSYSAGEGNEPFYGQSDPDKYHNQDFVAHRSEMVWSSQLKIGDVSMERDKNWFFVADSGATVGDYFNERHKDSYTVKVSGISLRGVESEITQIPLTLPPQQQVFDTLKQKKHKADYVTLSKGAQEMGFAEIVKQATYLGRFDPNNFRDMLNEKIKIMDDVINRLKEMYMDIHEKAGDQAQIIVAGYPHLMNPDALKYLSIFPPDNAKEVNSKIDLFNERIKKVVEECNETAGDTYFHFVSVKNGFFGHEAYTDKNYLNGVELVHAQDIDQTNPLSSYSMHPNEYGIEVYRKAVQDKIDELEGKRKDNKESVHESHTSLEELNQIAEHIKCNTLYYGPFEGRQPITEYKARIVRSDSIEKLQSDNDQYGQMFYQDISALHSSKPDLAFVLLMGRTCMMAFVADSFSTETVGKYGSGAERVKGKNLEEIYQSLNELIPADIVQATADIYTACEKAYNAWKEGGITIHSVYISSNKEWDHISEEDKQSFNHEEFFDYLRNQLPNYDNYKFIAYISTIEKDEHRSGIQCLWVARDYDSGYFTEGGEGARSTLLSEDRTLWDVHNDLVKLWEINNSDDYKAAQLLKFAINSSHSFLDKNKNNLICSDPSKNIINGETDINGFYESVNKYCRDFADIFKVPADFDLSQMHYIARFEIRSYSPFPVLDYIAFSKDYDSKDLLIAQWDKERLEPVIGQYSLNDLAELGMDNFTSDPDTMFQYYGIPI